MIIRRAFSKNPKVVTIIGQTGHAWEPFPAMRAKMVELAKVKTTDASPVLIVDLSQGWISEPDQKDTHTVDWVHPNEKGDARIAKSLFDAMLPFLKKAGAAR